MPRLITGLDAAGSPPTSSASASRSATTCAILAAVKYVPLEELGDAREAGVTLLGENRAQDLEDKATALPRLRLALHRPAAVAQGQADRPAREPDPHVASESALSQLETHGTPDTEILIEVNVAGEADKAGIAPDELARYLEARPCKVIGLMTMPPFTADPEDSRPHFARLRELADEHGLHEL